MAKGKKKGKGLSETDVAGIDKIKNAPPLKSRPLDQQRNLVAEKAFSDSLGDDAADLERDVVGAGTPARGEVGATPGLDAIDQARTDRAYERGAVRNRQEELRTTYDDQGLIEQPRDVRAQELRDTLAQQRAGGPSSAPQAGFMGEKGDERLNAPKGESDPYQYAQNPDGSFRIVGVNIDMVPPERQEFARQAIGMQISADNSELQKRLGAAPAAPAAPAPAAIPAAAPAATPRPEQSGYTADYLNWATGQATERFPDAVKTFRDMVATGQMTQSQSANAIASLMNLPTS